MDATLARVAFITWLKANFPQLYTAAMERALQPQLSGFLDTVSGAFQSFTDAVPKLAQTYVDVKSQLAAINLNISRAQQGLYPIDPKTGQIITSNATVPARVDTAIAAGGPVNTAAGFGNNWLLIAGGALVLLLLMRK